MDSEGWGKLAIERHLAQVEQVRGPRAAAIRIGRRKFADHAGRRIGLGFFIGQVFIGQVETIAVANKSVAYRLAGHVCNPGLA
jgi:hypothetical protein